MKWVLRAALVLLAFAGWPAPSVNACSCNTSGPPCEAYWKSPAVFVGTPTSATIGDITFDNGRHERMRVLRFHVEEAFKGIDGAEVEVRTGFGGGDCGYEFVVGSQYIVYAGRRDGEAPLYTSICSRTAPIAEAGDDLAYIRNLANAAPGGVVFGRAVRYADDVASGERREAGPIVGAKVVVSSGDRRFETVTGDDGRFRFDALPPGAYHVVTTFPEGLTPQEPRDVEVSDKGCAELFYWAFVDGRVSGRVLGSRGEPLKLITVDLIPVESLATDRRGLWKNSEDDGSFEFTDVPAGRYVLCVNPTRPSETTDEYPVPTTFFPGGEDPAAARVISVGESQRVTGVEFRLPSPLRVRVVTGVVVWPDGTPVAGASVHVEDPSSPGAYVTWPVKTGADGRFTTKAFEGRSQKLEASVPEDPNWDPNSGKAVGLLVAEPVTVTVGAGLGPVKLVIEPRDGSHRASSRVVRAPRR